MHFPVLEENLIRKYVQKLACIYDICDSENATPVEDICIELFAP